MIFLSKNKIHYSKGVFSMCCWIRLLSFLLFCIFLISCKTSKQIVSKNTKSENAPISYKQSDSLNIITSSTNLSEDMSTLSSNNDEIALFLFSFTDSTISEPAYFNHYFVLDKNNMSDTLHFNNIKSILNKSLILFLLEMDTDKKMVEIEPLIRKNYNALIRAYTTKN